MAGRLRLLHTVTEPTGEPFEARLRRALSFTATLLKADIGVFSHVEGEAYTVVAAHSAAPAPAAGDTFPLDDTYCSLTLAHGDVLAIDHMGRSEYAGSQCYRVFGMESYIGTPVTVGGALYGTLCFAGDAPAVFSDADGDLIRVLASWVGQSLDHHSQQTALVEQSALVQGLYDASPLLMGVVELVDEGDEADVLHRSANAATAALYGTTPEAMRDRTGAELGPTPGSPGSWPTPRPCRPAPR